MVEIDTEKIKAIDTLERLFSDSSNTDYPFTDEFGTAIKDGVEALAKQVSKKPIMRYFDEFESEYLCCPICKGILTDRIPGNPKTFYFHCMNCGQKLDWSDTD